MNEPITIIINTMIDLLDCSEEEGYMIADEIMSNLFLEGYRVVTD